MATTRDYYEILGVARDCSGQELKVAYRKLAVRYHPDKNPGDRQAEERFKEAAEAYAVLSDADKRARYDRFGHQGVGGAAGNPFSGGGFDPSIFGDFGDILSEMFGMGGRRSRRGGPTRGADLRYDLAISFEEAVFGSEETLRIPRLEGCETCGGSGSEGGRPPESCTTCGGRGQVAYRQGFLTVARPCPRCNGEGRVVSDPCRDCRGEGRVERERSIEVRIPPGVDHGSRLRMTGEGEHGRRGGPAGDLYVVLAVQPHERFQRDGTTILSEEEIGYAQAVLGASVEVETVHGEATLEVPPGTAGGSEFRLRGKGVDRVGGGGRGDHVVRVAIRVPHPRELSEEEAELLRKLAELSGQTVREGMFEKVKKMFG